MQSLISPVDHESWDSTYQADDESQTTSETTPLLYRRFPTPNGQNNVKNFMVIGCLMISLICGFGIGVYLLSVQVKSENIINVENFLNYVPRPEWDVGYSPPLSLGLGNEPTFKADCVVVHQTDTRTCEDKEECIVLLRELKDEAEANKQDMPFNFLIGSDGHVYEYLGMAPTSYIPDRASLVLGFIGNYTHVPPTKEQIHAAKNIIDQSVLYDRLDHNYTIVGKDKDELKYRIDDPRNLINEVDRLMFVILTRMYKNISEAMQHM